MQALTDDDKAVLRKAADEILRRGVSVGQQGEGLPSECSVCTLSAVALACGRDTWEWASLYDYGDGSLFVGKAGWEPCRPFTRIVDALADALPDRGARASHPVKAVYRWNDRTGPYEGLPLPSRNEVAELFLNVADNY